MKNEVLVNAITGIDDDLISDAHASAKGKVLPLKKLLAAAACFVLMTAGVNGFIGYNRMSVTAFEKEIGEQSVIVSGSEGASPARLIGETECAKLAAPMSIDVNRKTEISVSGGSIAVLDPKTNAVVYEGNSYTAQGETSVVWFAEATEQSSCFEMRLVTGKRKQIITLCYSENQWTMKKTKN